MTHPIRKKMADRRSPSRCKRSFGARSIAYEFGMLWVLANLQSPATALHPDVVRVAMLESLLLHLRGLREFFRSDSGDADTVLAADFGPSVLPPWENIIEREGPRLNKLMSHVSYSRRGLPRNWDFSEIANIVRGRLPSRAGGTSQPPPLHHRLIGAPDMSSGRAHPTAARQSSPRPIRSESSASGRFGQLPLF